MALADINWSARLASTSGNVPPMYGVCRDAQGVNYVIATTANLAIANGLIGGISMTAGAPNGTIAVQFTGEIEAAVSGLGVGAASFVELNAVGAIVRAANPGPLTVGICGTNGNILLGNTIGISSLPIVFDDAVAGNRSNIRSNRAANQSLFQGSSNALVGQTNFGSDTGTTGSLGVTGNYATCVGGDMPSIVGDYAGGGGYRVNARSLAAWAFGYAAFADGEACFAAGRSVVAGRIPTDPLGEAKFSICMGASSNATGQGAICLGGNNNATADRSTCIGFGCAASDSGAVAMGVSSTASASQAFGAGGGQSLGVGGAAFGATTNASDYGFTSGNSCTTSNGASYAIAQGLLCSVQSGATHGRAFGRQSTAIRIGQEAWSGGQFAAVGDAQWSKYQVKGTSTNGSAAALVDLGGNNLTLENGKTYAVKATTIAGRTDAAGRAMFIHDLLVHCTTGTAVIDNDNATLAVANGTAWTVAYTASTNTILCTFTGTAGQTIRGVTTYEWTEIGGLA